MFAFFLLLCLDYAPVAHTDHAYRRLTESRHHLSRVQRMAGGVESGVAQVLESEG